MIAGCGNQAASTPADTTGGDTAAAPAATSGDASGAKQTDGKNLPTLTTEPMEILLWDIATEEPGRPTQEAAVARFMADYPNIHVEQIHQQNDNYKQQLVVAMSSGQCPDMYISWGGGPMAEYYNSGYADDITDRKGRGQKDHEVIAHDPGHVQRPYQNVSADPHQRHENGGVIVLDDYLRTAGLHIVFCELLLTARTPDP